MAGCVARTLSPFHHAGRTDEETLLANEGMEQVEEATPR